MAKEFPGIYLSKVIGVWSGSAPLDPGLPAEEWPVWAQNHCWVAVINPRLAGDHPIFCRPKSSFGGAGGLGRMELPQLGYFVFMYWVVGEPTAAPFWEGTYWPEGSSPPALARPDNRIIFWDASNNLLYAQDNTGGAKPQVWLLAGEGGDVLIGVRRGEGDVLCRVECKDDGTIDIRNDNGQIRIDPEGVIHLN
jgi:hypothetical protein